MTRHRLFQAVEVAPEVPRCQGSCRMSDAARMARFSVTEIEHRSRLRQAGVEPVRGLVNNSEVTLAGICIGDQKLQAGILSQRTKDYAQDPGL